MDQGQLLMPGWVTGLDHRASFLPRFGGDGWVLITGAV